MVNILRKVLFSFAFIFLSVPAFAQEVTFNIQAPSLVAVGEVFRVEYTIQNARPNSFPDPRFEGFDVIAGPSTSQRSNFFFDGTNTTQSVIYSYTYVLLAKSEGKFTIPSVTVTANGSNHTASSLPIEVVSAAAASNAGQSSGRADAQSQPQGGTGRATEQTQPQSTIADDDILLRAVVNKNTVYRGQPVRVSFKLYTRPQVSNIAGARPPAFNGFWTQQLDVNTRATRETYNNKIYDVHVISEYLVYPQQAGTLQIESFELDAIAQIVTQPRRQSLLDDFFGGGPRIQEVRKRVNSAPVRITVNDLPANAPEGFSGAVGDFTLSAEISDHTIAANTASTYTIRISGTGNLPLIQTPKLELPNSFELFNVKATESLNRSGSGISGNRQFEYPFIARAEGEYVIEPVKFTYFNPESGRYITLATPEMSVTVMPDSSGMRSTTGNGGLVTGFSKEELKILGQDIRFIKIGAPRLRPVGTNFICSWPYFMVVGLLVLLFAGALIYLQKRIKELANKDALRGKRANKVALARLKIAEGYMKTSSERKFHDEMLKALWGYMSDKLNIPVANLTKENVRDGLIRRNIPQDIINKYISLISECEYAQYSPAESSQMPEIYRSAVEIISKVESYVRK